MSLMIVMEGETDRPVVTKLAEDAGFQVARVMNMRGKSQLDAHLQRYNEAARVQPWFILRDLDNDAGCAPDLRRTLCSQESSLLVLRIAVREVESWLLADTQAMAELLKVPEAWLPADPDAEPDPTSTLVNLARRSKRADVRERLVPRQGASAQVGPLFEASIVAFGMNHWSPERASRKSDSLRRARAALKALNRKWRAFTGDSG
jgi:hypothetical protein